MDEGHRVENDTLLLNVEVGDYADRKDRDLDPRPVASVEGNYITLLIGAVETQPLHMSLYRRIPKGQIEAVTARYAQ